MVKITKYIPVAKNSVLCCLLLCLIASPVYALDAVPLRADEQLLQQHALQFLVQINAARRAPLVVAERLGVDATTVREAFADADWDLEQGLPPLVWNARLVSSATAHGRDMFDRLYYSYVTPEGATVEQRIAAAGYPAMYVGESMNALFFGNYISLDVAFQRLVDIMLRDELCGNMSVDINIFSPDVTEVGIDFLAENIDLTGEQPYVYLLLLDFAAPEEQCHYLIINYDESSRVVARAAGEEHWIYPQQLLPGYAQVPYPESGGELVVVGGSGLGGVDSVYNVPSSEGDENVYLNLRTPK